jgi:diaminohydroxyphosphoribosylaminopyrimidine deaminase/5-amino-6-(5-phosphoribosylamino)uracil reductase
MRAALKEAAKGLGRTSPNPAVGAVLVDKGKIVAAGHHRGAGLPHAEIECLRRAPVGRKKTSTLYVTLEPCSTVGRTGACIETIIASGIKRVVVGAIDPNPRHRGTGLDQLKQAGLEVRAGVLADECASLNEAFNKWIVTSEPFVIAKCGMTLDGRLTRPPAEPRSITSRSSRAHARRLRSAVDAILVGAETIRQDDPRLTVRPSRGRHQPLRVLLTRSGKLPAQACVFRDRFADRTRVYRNRSLAEVLTDLGRQNVTSVLIEGGGEILGQALDQRLIDKIRIYVAPLLRGGPVVAFGGVGAADTQSAVRLTDVRYERMGNDVCLTGYAREKSAATFADATR